MKFGVVDFPGASDAADIIYVLEQVMSQTVISLPHTQDDLSQFTANDCIVLPNGSSYSDYLRPGALARLTPIIKEIIRFAQNGGYVFGVGNGFHILCEAGLLPGILLKNYSDRFVCKNVYLKIITSNSPISAAISPDEVLRLPVAHAWGRYFTDETTLNELIGNDQVLFRYCDEKGNVNNSSNPDGSIYNIAGICNKDRNVFALMPLPERAAEAFLNNEDGRMLFESLVRTAKTDIINQ